MSTVFTKIIEGEIPSYKVVEDENFIAFLDIFPMCEGHTLVVPKKEVDKFFDLDEPGYLAMMHFVRRIAKAQEKAFDCNRVGMIVMGLDVPHAHVHLLPINRASDMDITKEKLKFTPEQFALIAEKIRKNL